MRTRFTGIGVFGCAMIVLSLICIVLNMIDGQSFVAAVHPNLANMAMGIALIAWARAEENGKREN